MRKPIALLAAHRRVGSPRGVASLTVTFAMALLIAGCGGGGASGSQTIVEAAATQGSATVKPTPGYPGSVVILGDSRGTGDDSDPNRPNTDVPSNDWATGTNRAVDSVYLRLLARDPAIKGHNYNLAQDGTNVHALAHNQAPRAVKLTPAPQLFLISTGGNDITTCPAHAAAVKAYGATLAKALSVLASGAPQSHTFIVSQWGSPATYAKALPTPDRQQVRGNTPASCTFFDSKGRVIPKKIAQLEATIHSYDAEAQAVCARFSRCRYDGGAFGRVVDRLSYFSENLSELSIAGHAKAAAVAWAAMQRTGIIPL
jgi:hypothetical protein